RATRARARALRSRAAARCGLELDRRKAQLADLLHCGQRDGKVLDGEAGAVEDRDVVRRLTAGGRVREDVSELGHLLARDLARLYGVHELAVVAGLVPLVVTKANQRQIIDRDT